MTKSSDFSLPFNSLTQYVPQALRNTVISGLIENLFNRFMTRDESVPFYGYVGEKPSSPEDRLPAVPATSPERDVNAVIPIISFKVGSEEKNFTVQDLINKAKALGCSDTLEWLYSQGNNFKPPIDFDKFANFYSYYWVAKAFLQEGDLSWNPKLQPEYYVIAQPKPDSLDKTNARVMTEAGVSYQLTGSGFVSSQFKITFTSPNQFIVEIVGGGISGIPGPAGFYTTNSAASGPFCVNAPSSYQLLFDIGTTPSADIKVAVTGPRGTSILTSFVITRGPIIDANGDIVGTETFAPGDEFNLSVTYLTELYSVTFSGSFGIKGKLSGITSLQTYQIIDGVQLRAGDRVLVQTSPAAAGIYIVSPGAWARAPDFSGPTAVGGARVFVRDGTAPRAGTLFSSQTAPGGFQWVSIGQLNNSSDWQEGNFWLHIDEVRSRGIDQSKIVPAKRPIIEYDSALQLNSHSINGMPAEPPDASNPNFVQRKVRFNQLPLFDLFRYDGTHSGLSSSIFYYEEDGAAEIDLELQRRVKRANNGSGDLVFNHGCADEEGRLLFFKRAGALETVWHAGYISPTVSSVQYRATGNGEIEISSVGGPQQIWTLKAISSSVFNISGSKNRELPAPYDKVLLNVPYNNGYLSLRVLPGSVPFQPGDEIVIAVGNLEITRYVYRAEDGRVNEFFGGAGSDVDGVGAYQVPRTFIHNPYNDSRAEVAEGSLYSHFRGVLSNQISASTDYAFGGTIKLWSEQQALLASLLMQEDLTPASLIDVAKTQYEVALNTVRDIYLKNVLEYFSTVQVAHSSSPTEVVDLVDALLAIRAGDLDVKTVLYDTTSGVTGFPPTLPQLRAAPAVEPTIRYDQVLGRIVLQHHDGHLSAPEQNTQSFKEEMLGNYVGRLVPRSDGTSTPAITAGTPAPPVAPYKGELWLSPNGTIFVFDVDYDTSAPPPVGPAGELWFRRSTRVLHESDGGSWVALPSADAAWQECDLAQLLNAVTLEIEKRLYRACSPVMRVFDFAQLDGVAEYQSLLENELFSFATRNGLDPLATGFNSADAFTWNYSGCSATTFAPLMGLGPTDLVPARWFSILKLHQQTITSVNPVNSAGIIPTERPNEEPWKLFGYSTFSSWWSALMPTVRASYTAGINTSELDDGTFFDYGTVRVVAAEAMTGVPTGLIIIDGVQLTNGDRVLVANNTNPLLNGIYFARAGAWTRDVSVPFSQKVAVVAERSSSTSPARYAGSVWALSAPVLTNMAGNPAQPAIFKQVRLWTNKLWQDVKLIHPLLRLSVNTFTDELLPPYVAISLPSALEALTTTLPPVGTASLAYEFGEGSPVESLWRRSIEFGYAQLRALMRYDPLAALGFCWGFNWIEVDGILYDGFEMNMPGHKRLKLHGEEVSSVDRSGSLIITGSGPALELTFDGYETVGASRYQSFTARRAGEVVGTVRVNVTTNILGWSIRLNDRGIPFRMGDRVRVTTPSPSFIPATSMRWYGLGQTFTHALRASAVDTSSSYAISALRGWDVDMGYRVGGLAVTDDLVVFTDDLSLGPSSYRLRIKKNPFARTTWLQALRVSVEEKGASSPDGTPLNGGADWKFTIEGYVPQFPQIKKYVLDTIASGTTFPLLPTLNQRFFNHQDGKVYQFNGSTWIEVIDEGFVTFNAISGANTNLTWYNSQRKLGVEEVNLPVQVTGLQNLLTFIFGYAAYVEDEGWEFKSDTDFNVDDETGRSRDWQLYVEKVADRVYGGIEVGQGVIVNPFSSRAWLKQPTGLLAPFTNPPYFDPVATPAVFDVASIRFQTNDLLLERGSVRSGIRATAPMFAIHASIDEYEHLIIFSRFSEPSIKTGLLYDPFSGSRVATYKFNGRRQYGGTMRLEFGGHYIVKNEVRRNLQASIDSLSRVYDANYAFENYTTSRHALALLGFNKKDYFTNIDITDKSQFNFWRGLIHSKGTNLSFDAYLNNGRFKDARLDELWAYKIAEYGDARQRIYPELKLTVDDCLQQFTQLQFDALPGDALDTFIQVSKFDEDRWATIDDLETDTFFEAGAVGSYQKQVVAGEIIRLPFVADELVIGSQNSVTHTRLNATTLVATATDNIRVSGIGQSSERHSPLKLINYVEGQVVEEIVLWHPAAGYHTPTAIENVNIIGPVDPARYTYSTLIINNVNYDPRRPWGEKEVGRVWLDTRNLSYIPYYDATIFPNRYERLARWGALADFSTIDVYEWVKSTVPPSEYRALAQQQAGDADLGDKASGEPALRRFYHRDRQWFARPIAWSFASLSGGHPSFSASGSEKLYRVDTYFILGAGTFADRGITPGMRIGVWKPDPADLKPVSESVINPSQARFFGLDGAPDAPVVVNPSSDFQAEVTVSEIEYVPAIGTLVFEAQLPVTGIPNLDPDGNVEGYTFALELLVTAESGQSQLVRLDTLTSATDLLPPLTVAVGDTWTYDVAELGLRITVVSTVAGTFPGDRVLKAIDSALGSQVRAYDGVEVRDIIGINAGAENALTPWRTDIADNRLSAVEFSNEPEDELHYGWKAWSVPTQQQLDADGRQPLAAWKPYLGPSVGLSDLTIDQLAEAQAEAENPLTLNSGAPVTRYSTSWEEWVELTDTRYQQVALSSGPVTITHTEMLDEIATSVYVNGIIQLKAAYQIDGQRVTVLNVDQGSEVTVIIPKYAPSSEELAFNPDEQDDLTYQRHYKEDYEYVETVARNGDGSFGATTYYFWVKGKTTLPKGKKLSIQTVTQLVRDGPVNFLTFQHLLPPATINGDNLPWRYDAVTISNLSYAVTKSDTFKLRLLRDFTLREDPEELNLKNVHTEWSLMRRGQATRVPTRLWSKLVDSTAGIDAGGSAVPSLRRQLYDERYGTNTRFGFQPEQTLAPSSLLVATIVSTIVNTRLTSIEQNGVFPSYIRFINDRVDLSSIDQVADPTQRARLREQKKRQVTEIFFSTPEQIRATLTQIWTQASPVQVNEIFFDALEDVLASNHELTDIFKTSRLAIYSIQEKVPGTAIPNYE